ncbi:OmpH family outer membrane protein [Planktotalea sp.]|uniref:OmpH family outer membrane protein n=1 Tax=Planktotalea sp. TaxID=2029877 RepID=UPI003296F31C
MTSPSRQNSKEPRLARAFRALGLTLCVAFTAPISFVGQASAQSSGFSLPDIPVLTIEPDLLFANTRFGQRLSKDIEARVAQHAGENRRIEKELADEESELTGLRETMDAVEFRALADEFDQRVMMARNEQDVKARAIASLSEQAQRGFLQAIAPILEEMMIENGASVILDRRAVFLSADVSDITTEAIIRIDQGLEDGDALSELLPQVEGDAEEPQQ